MKKNKKENLYSIKLSGTGKMEEGKFRKQLLRYGTWTHADAPTGKLIVNKDTVKKIIANFKDKILDNVPVTLNHTDEPDKIVGNVTDLIQTDTGMDAIMEIKDKNIISKIKDKLIKGISASILPNYRDKELDQDKGETLIHSALVSEPYIKKMAGFVPLSEFKDMQLIELSEEKMKSKKKKRESLKEEVKPEIVTEKEEVIEEKAEVKEETTEKKAEKKEPEAEVKKDLDKTDNKEDELEIETKDESETELSEKLSKSEAKIVELKQELRRKEADDYYSKLLNAGKIIPAQKDAVISLFSAEVNVINLADNKESKIKDLLKSFFDSQPKMFDLKESGKTNDDDKKVVLSSYEKDLVKRSGISEKEYIENRDKGFSGEVIIKNKDK